MQKCHTHLRYTTVGRIQTNVMKSVGIELPQLSQQYVITKMANLFHARRQN